MNAAKSLKEVSQHAFMAAAEKQLSNGKAWPPMIRSMPTTESIPGTRLAARTAGYPARPGSRSWSRSATKNMTSDRASSGCAPTWMPRSRAAPDHHRRQRQHRRHLGAALALAADLPGVRAVRIDRPGRGGALRSVWSASEADVCAYMDVDLSTDLNALLPLVAPLLSGHSDVAIGTRLARGARVIRGPNARSSPAATTCCCTPRSAPGFPTRSAGSRPSAPMRPARCCR